MTLILVDFVLVPLVDKMCSIVLSSILRKVKCSMIGFFCCLQMNQGLIASDLSSQISPKMKWKLYLVTYKHGNNGKHYSTPLFAYRTKH